MLHSFFDHIVEFNKWNGALYTVMKHIGHRYPGIPGAKIINIIEIPAYHYSYLNDSAGLTPAVLVTCELTVTTAITKISNTGHIKNHQPILMR